MKIILSRKGFDSQYGGGDSPILPDGRLVSLPIPSGDAIRYGDVRAGGGLGSVAQLIEQLYGPARLPRIGETCHLDPDIARAARRRPPAWRGVLGQMGAAQGHLAGQGVGVGDLFLFFGRFRPTENSDGGLRFVPRSLPVHMIFGYLQVGEVIDLAGGAQVPRWLRYHPHVQARQGAGSNNTLYVAAAQSDLVPGLPGWGCLDCHPGLRLTVADSPRISEWALPKSVFGNASISYHSAASWRDGYFRAASRGQEFVIDSEGAARCWAAELIKRGTS